MKYGLIQYDTVWYDGIRYDMIWYDTIRFNMGWYYTIYFIYFILYDILYCPHRDFCLGLKLIVSSSGPTCNGWNQVTFVVHVQWIWYFFEKSHFSFSVLCPKLHWTHLHSLKMKYKISPVFFHGKNTLGIMTMNGANLRKRKIRCM